VFLLAVLLFFSLYAVLAGLIVVDGDVLLQLLSVLVDVLAVLLSLLQF
jgi:hypothetical protein